MLIIVDCFVLLWRFVLNELWMSRDGELQLEKQNPYFGFVDEDEE